MCRILSKVISCALCFDVVRSVSMEHLVKTFSCSREQVPGKFYLDLPLPFKGSEDKAKATFDKHQSVLTLTLPVRCDETNAIHKNRRLCKRSLSAILYPRRETDNLCSYSALVVGDPESVREDRAAHRR